MTEYDYSPEAYERYMATQERISRWVRDTNEHIHPHLRPPTPPSPEFHRRPNSFPDAPQHAAGYGSPPPHSPASHSRWEHHSDSHRHSRPHHHSHSQPHFRHSNPQPTSQLMSPTYLLSPTMVSPTYTYPTLRSPPLLTPPSSATGYPVYYQSPPPSYPFSPSSSGYLSPYSAPPQPPHAAQPQPQPQPQVQPHYALPSGYTYGYATPPAQGPQPQQQQLQPYSIYQGHPMQMQMQPASPYVFKRKIKRSKSHSSRKSSHKSRPVEIIYV